MQDIYYRSSDGVTTVHACLWQPSGDVKGVVQIIHGMAEYAERYAPFAGYLNSHGYVVCAEDHLGHGKSVTGESKLGYFSKSGWRDVLADIRSLTELVRPKFDGKPYFVLGHSMGSFFCRKYISLYGNELAGAVVMGTAFQPKIATGCGKLAARIVALFKGWEHRSKFVNDLAFGSYNKRFEKRTEYDWLSADPKNVDNYIADELCGVPFTCNAFYGLFSICSEACKGGTIRAVPKTLPVYFVAGGDDPVGNYSKGVKKAYGKFCKAGVEDVSLTVYNGARHEILNDCCAPQVYEDVLGFFDGKLDK